MPRPLAYFLLFTFTNSMLYLSVMSSTLSSPAMAASQVLPIIIQNLFGILKTLKINFSKASLFKYYHEAPGFTWNWNLDSNLVVKTDKINCNKFALKLTENNIK